MFTDTDSLFYEIKTEDAYKDLYEKKRRLLYFDTSDYQKKKANIILKKIKKVIGKMKNEAAGAPTKEFVGLRSKMYLYYLDDKCIKNVKAL